ncbi:MAG: hypothetical protein Q9161_007065 [Pseudevernia consocians]
MLILLSGLLTPPSTATATTPQTPSLQKRRPPFSVQNLYLEQTAHLTMLLPTTLTASLLSDFYAEIHVRCITYWMPNLPPPQADLVVQWGGFQLSFVAHDGATEGISWEFIRDFSAIMLRVTRRGYTGVYDQGWWNLARTLGVYVGLRVVDVGVGGGGPESVGSSL